MIRTFKKICDKDFKKDFRKGEEYMKVWTIIPYDEYVEFEKHGYLVCDDKHEKVMANEYYLYQKCYDWMSSCLREKVDSDLKYPRWVWLYTNDHNPYMNKLDICQAVGKFYILVFDINSDEILFSDFDLWHCCLNGGLVTEEREDEVERLAEQLDIDMRDIFDPKYDRNIEVERIRNIYYEDWKKIFDVNEENDIQGVIWKLDKKDLIDVRWFEIREEEVEAYERELDEIDF